MMVLRDWIEFGDPADRALLDEYEEFIEDHPNVLEIEWSPGLEEMIRASCGRTL